MIRELAGKSAVLALLKREGPISADALAARLSISPMAVRQHLQVLAADDLALAEEAPPPESRGRGRPLKLWRTGPKADSRFADSHSLLATDLLEQMKKTFGEAGLNRLLALRTSQQEKSYRAEMDSAPDLGARLQILAAIREREGYMAELRRDGDDWLFVENHCPVCAAAKLCSGLCREELSLFNRVLDGEAMVTRVSHILAGAGRCAYRVTAV